MKNRGGLIILVILVIAGVFGWSVRLAGNDPRRAALRHRELATRTLGQFITELHPGSPVLVISNPFTKIAGRDPDTYRFDEAGIEGLRQGLPKDTPLRVSTPSLRAGVLENPQSAYVDPRTTTPLSYLVAEDSFDRLAAEHPDCSILVSLVGLPLHVEKSGLWKGSDRPPLALLLPDWSILGGRRQMLSAFASGRIIAAVMPKPGAPPEIESGSRDHADEFAARFLLITRENVEQMVQDHPELF